MKKKSNISESGAYAFIRSHIGNGKFGINFKRNYKSNGES